MCCVAVGFSILLLSSAVAVSCHGCMFAVSSSLNTSLPIVAPLLPWLLEEVCVYGRGDLILMCINCKCIQIFQVSSNHENVLAMHDSQI